MFSTVVLAWSLGVNHNGVLMVLEGWKVVRGVVGNWRGNLDIGYH